MKADKTYEWLTSNGKINGGVKGNGENSETEAAPSAREEAETSVQELRNRYSAKVKENFETAANRLKAERDDALRENWILQQKAKAALPEQMAAGGINGGASETTFANLNAQYQGNRNDIRKGYAENLEELGEKASEQQAENEDKYNRQWLEYLLSMAALSEKREKGL